MADDPENSSSFTAKKKVDESWKDAITKEKEGASFEPADSEGQPVQDTSFSFFVSTLGMQTLAVLGELPDPVTHEKIVNLEQAQYLIDVIQMFSEKTKGNLSPEEETMIGSLLYELRIKFVQKSQQP